MTDKKKNGWIKFVPSLDLPKERVSIAYDTHDERGVRYAYGYFQFYNGTCGCFWKDGNEQPKVIKAEDIKYWMPVPSLDMQEEPVSEDFGSMADKYHKEVLIGECQMNDDMAGHCRLSYYLGLKDGAKWQKKRDYIPLSDNINEVARQICNKVLNCEIDYKEDDVVLSDEEECVKAGIRWQMQKESIVSEDLEKTSKVWHDSNKEQPKTETTVVIWHPNDKYGEVLTRCVEVYSDRIWAYMDDLLRM
jgi:hypothetical protein